MGSETIAAMAVAAVWVENEFLTPASFIPSKQANQHSSPCDVSLLCFFDGEISSPAYKVPPVTTDSPSTAVNSHVFSKNKNISDEERLHKILNEPEPFDDYTFDPEFVAARLAILLGDTPDELLDVPFHCPPHLRHRFSPFHQRLPGSSY